MSKPTNIIQITNTTLVTGVTSTLDYLVFNINERNVGLPLYTFSQCEPSFDFMYEDPDLTITDATIVHNATAYGGAMAISVNGTGRALPVFKIDTGIALKHDLRAVRPTIVSQLTSVGQYMTVRVNNEFYGIPLFDYSTSFPFTVTTPSSSIPVTTTLVRPAQDVADNVRPGTNLNSKITTYSAVIKRIKYMLGEPFVSVEVCDDTQMIDFIDQALEWYTKYAGYTEEFLVFSSSFYKEPGLQVDKLFSITPSMRASLTHSSDPSWDYDLGDYRKVAGIFSFQQGETTGINTLFTLEQAMAQQTYFSYMLGNVGFDLVTWEVMKGWLDMREKVLAQVPYVDFDQRRQLLRIIPAPVPGSTYVGVVGCFVEKAIADLISERWVWSYALALTKIAVANARGKYQGMNLFGGGTINYNDILSQGLKEKDELEKELMNGYGEVTPARFFVGSLAALLLPSCMFLSQLLSTGSQYIA